MTKKTKAISTKVKPRPAPTAPSAEPPMSQPQSQPVDLGSLFANALEVLTAKRQDLNALDGHNGNHGDNMVTNLRLITEALQSKKSEPPAEALRYAGQVLQSQGAGGTSQYYAAGLQQAAAQFQGRPAVTAADVMPLLQTLLSAVPAQGYPQPQQPQAGGSILDQLLGMQMPMQQPVQQPMQQPAGAGLLGQLLGMQAPAPQPQPQPQQQPQAEGLDVGDVLTALLPAGLAFLQAKQAGADTTAAAGQALIAALAGGQFNPLQTNSPRVAAGGLIMQALLQALLGKR